MSAAYRSALDISFEVRAGLVMRQIHHWASLIFMASMLVRPMRVGIWLPTGIGALLVNENRLRG